MLLQVRSSAQLPHTGEPQKRAVSRRAHSPVALFLFSSRSSMRVGTRGLGGGGCGGGGAGARLFFFCKSICDPRDTCEAHRKTVSVGVVLPGVGCIWDSRLGQTPWNKVLAARWPVPFLGSLGRQRRQRGEALLCRPRVTLR